MIDVVATSDFVHGKFAMTKRGEASLPEQLAKDLKAVGLVVLASDVSENKAAPTVANKMAPPARNKSAKAAKASAPEAASDAGAQTGASADVCTEMQADTTAVSLATSDSDIVPAGGPTAIDTAN